VALDTFKELKDGILDKLQAKASYLGIASNNIYLGKKEMPAPAISIFIEPNLDDIFEDGEVDDCGGVMHIAICPKGTASDDDAMNDAVIIASKVLLLIGGNKQLTKMNNISFVETFSDRTSLMLSIDCVYSIDVKGPDET
jgi:hypothetical protein